MEQNRELTAIETLLRAHLTDFGRRPDIFLDRELSRHRPVRFGIGLATNLKFVAKPG